MARLVKMARLEKMLAVGTWYTCTAEQCSPHTATVLHVVDKWNRSQAHSNQRHRPRLLPDFTAQLSGTDCPRSFFLASFTRVSS